MFAKKPSSLRRVKIFAEFSDTQLERFRQFMEVLRVRQFTEVVKQGVHGDAMYFVLEGELRVRLMVSGKETILVSFPRANSLGRFLSRPRATFGGRRGQQGQSVVEDIGGELPELARESARPRCSFPVRHEQDTHSPDPRR